MTSVAAALTARVKIATTSVQAVPLRRVRQIGCIALSLQLLAFLIWDTILYQRFAVSADFAIYHQSWYLIAHGNLNPYSTLLRIPYWQSHSELIMWPVALLYWVWPYSVILLWLQDFCVTAAEMVAFIWMCEIAEQRRSGRESAWLAGAGLALLVADPWIWWAISFDFHAEMIALPFAVLLARDLARGRRRAWMWAAFLLLCGDVAATYLAGVGLGGMLARRHSRRPGAVMAFLGVGATLLISLIHANLGGHLDNYAYLATGGSATQSLTMTTLIKGMATHPLNVLRTLVAKRVDMMANLAPSGFLGIGDLAVLPLILVVMLENTLYSGLVFAEPIFQSAPIYLLMPIGTVAVLAWIARRHQRVTMLLASLVVVQALGWATVWGPRTFDRWLRVNRATAITLESLNSRIPASDQVIVSQGVSGRFAGRSDIRVISRHHDSFPVTAPEVWFVITPLAGTEMEWTARGMAFIGELAGPMHATLVTHAHGVWAFRWNPPAHVHSITVPAPSAPAPAWAAPITPGEAGHRVLTGPVRNWHMASTGHRGYVADGLAWQESPGRYRATVDLSATGPVNVEVWNDTGHVLLARHSLPATHGVQSISLPVNATTPYQAHAYPGWGPFQARFLQPRAGERLEVRVWSPGAGTVNVYSAQLAQAGATSGRLGS